ncbi:MAG: discoidin domain-containing protein, partial [Tannerellaceae bacterium]|nr:discoidin domain-containing protein [Tannerellaceae bacterium]
HGKEPIPHFFRNPGLIDITGKFPKIGIYDIRIPFPDKVPNQFAYLCVFDPAGWRPVDWGRISGKEVVFKNVGKEVVYQLSLFNSSGVCPVGNPFLLDSIGNMHYFSPSEEKTNLVLERKQEISFSLLKYPNVIVESKFQGANTPGFSDAEDLYIIKEAPGFNYTTISVSSGKPYQYVRYFFSDTTQGNMAEVEFYETDSLTKLQGTVIGDYSPSPYYPLNGAGKMFDGDALTFFHTDEDKPGWGGLQFNKPVHIDRIRYLVRNDDNGIRKGEVYELLYMDNGNWVSMGRKTAAEDDIIVFEDVPKDALYWLRNHSKGKEERPFSYENDKQLFR